MKVLANDGVSQSGIDALEAAGFEVSTTTVAQEQLINHINQEEIPSLKIIGRGGVGMDNIDVDYAREKGLNVINTPAASSSSVAELVFAHLYGGVRFLYDANRNMPLDGDSKFKDLKKAYAKGVELRGKTIGIVGFGRIGQEVAKIALGVGMRVLAADKFMDSATIKLDFFDGQSANFEIKTQPMETVLKEADFITLHVPAQKEYVIGKKEFDLMKSGSVIINAARGGVINEVELVNALNDNKLSFAALDTFIDEPKPAVQVLMHPKVSLTPHIGAATGEAQDRIGTELAEQIIDILSS